MGRWKITVLVAVTVAWLVSCHVIPPYSPVVHIPAHTVRHFAAMSLPAFTAAGDFYVANGERLLHFAASGARPGESVLPVDLSQSPTGKVIYPHIYGTGEGDVFILLGDGRAGLLDAAGQFAWLKDVGASYLAAAPGPDGLFIQYTRGSEHGVALLDTQGDFRYSLTRPPASKFSWTVDEQGRGFFVIDGKLTITAPDGALLLDALDISIIFTDEEFTVSRSNMRICDARDGLALASDEEIMICLDLTGRELWRKQVLEHYQGIRDAVFIGDGRAVLIFDNNYPDHQAYMIVDRHGTQLAFKEVLFIGSITPTLGDGFLLDYTLETARLIALYDAGGIEQLAYHMALNRDPDQSNQGQVVPDYSSSWIHLAGADERYYFEEQSVLYALDGDGELAWQEIGTSYYDEWIPASTAE